MDDDADTLRALEEVPAVDPVDARQTHARIQARMFEREVEVPRIDRYVLGDRIGQGGAGVVYLARDPELDRDVAIKLLRWDNGTESAGPMRQRMLREGRAIARISHPNVVAVHDVGPLPDEEAGGGGLFIVMEFVPGQDGRRWRADHRPSWREELRVHLEAGKGLVAAHGAGVVHRDFKPSNILVGDDGRVCVVDFGLARDAESPTDSVVGDALPPVGPGSSDRLTETGRVNGTPRYMAPEQHRGAPVDGRTDQYAFCVSLYEGLYGRLPFDVDGEGRTILAAKEAGPLEPAPDSDVPPRVRAAVLRGLAPDPTRRFPDMATLLDALRVSGPARTRPWRWAAVGVATIAAVAGGFYVAGRTSNPAAPAEPTPAVPVAPETQRPHAVALLPFEDQTGDPRLDFAREGLPYLMGTELGRDPSIDVIGYYRILESMDGPEGPPGRWARAAKALGATVMLRGTLRRAPGGVEVAVTAKDVQGQVLAEVSRETGVERVPHVVRGLSAAITVQLFGHPLPTAAVRPGSFDFERHLQLAIAALERMDLDQANAQLDRALQAEPDNAEVHYYRAISFAMGPRRILDVRREIERALAGELTPAQEGLMRAHRQMLDQAFEPAISLLRDLDRRFPQDRYIKHALFDTLCHAGLPTEAMAAHRALRALSPTFTADSRHALIYYAAQGDLDGLGWARSLPGVDPLHARHDVYWDVANRNYTGAASRLGALASRDGADRGWARETLIAVHALRGDLSLARTLAEQAQTAGGWSLAERRGVFETYAPGLPLLAILTALGDGPGRARALERVRQQALANLDTPGGAHPWIFLVAHELPVATPTELQGLVEGLERTEPTFILERDVARVLLDGALGQRARLEAALQSPFPEVQAIAQAHLETGDPLAEAAAWERAAVHSLDGRFLAYERLRRAQALARGGRPAQAAEVCQTVVNPTLFSWSWGSTVGPCRKIIAGRAG